MSVAKKRVKEKKGGVEEEAGKRRAWLGNEGQRGRRRAGGK